VASFASPIGITGARGVLGRRLCAELRQRNIDFIVFDGDIRDVDAASRFVADAGSVVHAAAIVPVGRVSADPATAISVNVAGTASIARAAAEKPFAYVSTSHVYAPSSGDLSEDAATHPSSVYGWTKRQGEQWCEVLHPAPLILRLFSYYDVAQPETYLVPSLVRRIRETPVGGIIELAGADNVRDVADATWMAQTIALLLASGATGVVNCGTGQGRRVLDIAVALASSIGRDDVQFEGTDTREPSTRLVADTTRLRTLLPAVPPFDLVAGLRDFADA
jgi:UDP-glucose 4-epimerase/GDP-4-dehydro-6-deoxy-D-mannose reductase